MKGFRVVLTTLLVGMFILTACQPQVVVEEKVVIQDREVIKEVEKEVEVEKIVEVEKEVKEYVEVEVEKEGSAVALRGDNTFILAVNGSPPTFDPLAARDSRVDTPSINMYSALVQVTPDLELYNDLAASIDTSDDGKSYTVSLVKGVKFHDGSELVANDVKWTIDRMIALAKGVRSNLNLVTGAEVIDDYTVRIDLETPFPGMLMNLARLYIINSDLAMSHEEDGDWGEKWLQSNDAGSGPYQLVSYEAEQQFTIEQFPEYHRGWEGNHIERAIFRVIKEETTRQIALENGDVDWATIGTPETLASLKTVSGIKVSSDATLNQLYFALNVQNPNLTDVRVRQALSLVYDFTAHVEQARQGHSEVARGPLPSVIPYFDDSIKASETNIAKAKELMAEAGVPDGGFELEMAYQGTSPEETVAFQLMQAGAAEIGISLKPVAVEWPAKVGLFASQETAPGMGTIWVFPAYADPDAYLHVIGHSSLSPDQGGFNFSYFSNARFDELTEQGKIEMDTAVRADLYKEAQQIWVDEVPYINVALQYDLVAYRDYVKGYRWNSAHSKTQNIYDISLTSETEAVGSAESNTFIAAVNGSPPTFDPLAARDSRVDTPSINMYSALVQVTPDLELYNDLAASIDTSDDGKSYTVSLVKGVKFHDGSELVANDVKWTIDRMIALAKGVRSNLNLVTGAEVIDDYTVRIDLETPFPGMLMNLARLYIINSDLAMSHEEDGDWGEKWLQSNDAGSGPYQLVSYEAEQQFTIEQFPEYHRGWEGNHIERAIFRVIKEETTRQIALENGDVDWATIGTPETLASLKTVSGIKVSSDATLNQLYFALNVQNPNLTDVRVRQALSLVYDFTAHVEQARQGHSEVARGPLPSVIPYFDDSIKASETNIAKAKELMAEAGVPDGGFELEMAYQGTSPEETVAFQLMQAGAAEIGISLKPVAVEWPAKVGLFASQETAPGMGTIWVFPAYADPDAYLHVIGHSSLSPDQGGFNFSYFSNARFDELTEQGKIEMDTAVRADLYKEAQQIWVDEVPYINVALQYDLVAYRDYVKGYRWNSAHSKTQNIYDISLTGKP